MEEARKAASQGKGTNEPPPKAATKCSTKGANFLKKPSAKVTIMKKPAASKQPVKGQAAAKSKSQVSSKVDHDAAKLNKLKEHVPLAQLKLYPGGCSRCRNASWCTPSCWRLRGFCVP